MFRNLIISTLIVSLSSLSAAHAANHEVKLLTAGAGGQTMIMEPGYLKVAKGDTVTFTPADPSHNVESMAIPEGAEKFSSPMGQAFTYTFSQDGVYLYKCTPHFVMGMIGVIQVEQPTNLEAVQAYWTGIQSGVVMNKERVPSYLKQVK